MRNIHKEVCEKGEQKNGSYAPSHFFKAAWNGYLPLTSGTSFSKVEGINASIDGSKGKGNDMKVWEKGELMFMLLCMELIVGGLRCLCEFFCRQQTTILTLMIPILMAVLGVMAVGNAIDGSRTPRGAYKWNGKVGQRRCTGRRFFKNESISLRGIVFLALIVAAEGQSVIQKAYQKERDMEKLQGNVKRTDKMHLNETGDEQVQFMQSHWQTKTKLEGDIREWLDVEKSRENRILVRMWQHEWERRHVSDSLGQNIWVDRRHPIESQIRDQLRFIEKEKAVWWAHVIPTPQDQVYKREHIIVTSIPYPYFTAVLAEMNNGERTWVQTVIIEHAETLSN